MVQSVNFIWKWQVITELLVIPFPLSEQLSSNKRIKLEDQDLTYLERTGLNSQLLEMSQEPAKRDTEKSSKLAGQIPLNNDYDYINLFKYCYFLHFSILKLFFSN